MIMSLYLSVILYMSVIACLDSKIESNRISLTFSSTVLFSVDEPYFQLFLVSSIYVVVVDVVIFHVIIVVFDVVDVYFLVSPFGRSFLDIFLSFFWQMTREKKQRNQRQRNKAGDDDVAQPPSANPSVNNQKVEVEVYRMI